MPAQAANDFALAEQEVLADISAERERTASSLIGHLRAYAGALSTLQTGMDVAGMRHSADEAIARFHEIKSHFSGEVSALRANALQLANELQEFKRRNRIDRTPRLPKNRTMSIALLFVCAVAESLLNGVFFAGGSDFGLLGGIILAMGLSTINIVTGFVIGYALLRSIHRRNWLLSLAGMVAAAASCAAVVGFNGVVAHYRDLYQTRGDATEVSMAWSQFIGSTFELGSIYSWLLFVVGIIFSSVAVLKGYGFDDPYPGYGACERRRLAASAAYSERRRDLIEDARAVRDEYADIARDAIEKLRAASSQRQQTLQGRARLLSDYNSIEDNLAEAARQLLMVYREANMAARSTPPPTHFNQRFVFSDRALDRPEFKVLLVEQGLQHDADTLIDEFDSLRRRVHDEHAVILAQVPGEI
jgi:hypothetical protein